MKIMEITPNVITLYRGMESEYDPSHDLNRTDAPTGYSTWTDSLELAKQYAGDNGHIYQIVLPVSKMGDELIDADGERALFVHNAKPAGLNSVSGEEYLIYHDHDDFSPAMIKQAR